MLFRLAPRNGGRFCRLFGAHLLFGHGGGAALGLGPLRREPLKLRVLFSTDSGGTGLFGGGGFSCLSLLDGTLLICHAPIHGCFGKTFGLHPGRCLAGPRLGFDALPFGFKCLLLGLDTQGFAVPDVGFQFGATPGFARRFFLRRQARQCRGFGNLLGAQLAARQFDCATLRLATFSSQAVQLFLFFGPCRRGAGQFGGSAFAPPGLRKRALFGLDSLAQREFGHAFGPRLLFRGFRCRSLRGNAFQCLFRRQLLGLLPTLGRRKLLGCRRLLRLGGEAGPLVFGGARKSVGLGRTLGIRLVGRDGRIARRAFPAPALGVHQSGQYFAQFLAPDSGPYLACGCGRLTQTWPVPKVE